MASRESLHEKLLTISPNVYYQTPSSIKMQYPCIRYSLQRQKTRHADNIRYKNHDCYLVTYISRHVYDEIINIMPTKFTYCRFDRPYTADNLHHYVFEIYYASPSPICGHDVATVDETLDYINENG